MANPIRISASRLNSLDQCSWKFYCEEVLKLPSKTHPKTLVGTITHGILECLLNPRHQDKYNRIIQEPSSVYNCPVVSRYIKIQQNKHGIEQKLIDDIDEMVLLVLKSTDFLDKKADERFAPEHEFKFKIADKYEVKGFIDRIYRKNNLYCIIDYKTKGSRFSEEELKYNYQAIMYQMYVMKKFNCQSEVCFIMLRHPPTKKDDYRHIQKVMPRTKEELEGFEIYLEYLGEIFKNFTIEHAYNKFCADNRKTKSFCTYVCPFRTSFKYQKVIDNQGNTVKTGFIGDTLELKDGETLEICDYQGCPRFLA